MKEVVPLWLKLNLTIEEAADYSGIGRDRIRKLCNDPNCPFVLCVGTKKLVRRSIFEKYIENISVI